MNGASLSDIWKRSWGLLWKNPALFMPYVWEILFFLPLLGLIALEYWWIDFAAVSALDPGIIALVLIAIIIDLLIFVVISSLSGAMRLGLTMQAALGKKTSYRSCFLFVRKYFWTLLEARIIFVCIAAVPGILLSLLVLGMYFASPVAALVVGIMALLLYAGYLVVVGILCIFLSPVIASKNLSGYGAVKFSIKYFFTRPGHVLGTWVMSIFPTFVIGMVFGTILALFGLSETVVALSGPGIIVLCIRILQYVSSIIVRLWMSVFIYGSFFSKNTAPKF